MNRTGLIITQMLGSGLDALMLYSCSVSREADESMGLQIKMNLKYFPWNPYNMQQPTSKIGSQNGIKAFTFPETALCGLDSKRFL